MLWCTSAALIICEAFKGEAAEATFAYAQCAFCYDTFLSMKGCLSSIVDVHSALYFNNVFRSEHTYTRAYAQMHFVLFPPSITEIGTLS